MYQFLPIHGQVPSLNIPKDPHPHRQRKLSSTRIMDLSSMNLPEFNGGIVWSLCEAFCAPNPWALDAEAEECHHVTGHRSPLTPILMTMPLHD